MLSSFSTACLYHLPLRTTFRLAAEAGFDGVELVMSPETWLRGPNHVAKIAQRYNLVVYSVHQTLLCTSPRGGGAERIADAVDAALALGARCVVAHTPWAEDWSKPTAQRWLHTIEICQERLCGSGTRLSLENRGIYSADQRSLLQEMPALFDFVEGRDLAITLDTCHVGTQDLAAAYQLLKDRLVNLHLSDLCLSSRNPLSPLVRALFTRHQMPGQGGLPLDDLMRQLAADDFAGAVTVEVSPLALGMWPSAKMRKSLAKIVSYIRSFQ
ncbi:MAG: sugar phosphate isomerase/epimerase [Chloroflexota bacterium]|nr:sugar phosphate isomerase/epimerase [Chloroflexota bacterium]